ncbi:5-dehydro-4-deoxy-D-glucuronate isomerase [Alicyclobacillus herbarius]|uniref:5-dehydro-4-deoxy-D-glucuronate isomerase n=1 Tax=Alicyclobacillus herbarius TaxID=122960 RepID=UPI0004791A47|nr:5-dehydro-4-deoxy-D-glucuronate isomerase [Alicyclobacillus herbarius]
MEIRHPSHPADALQYSTERLRQEFLVEGLFEAGEIHLVYTHHDRMLLGGAAPLAKSIVIENIPELRTNYFLERREVGIINIGREGAVHVDDETHNLGPRECLYVGLGRRRLAFSSTDPEHPARFYLVSAPAHRALPTRKATLAEAEPEHVGADAQSNRRIIYRFIHEGGIKSCQLMMGMTVLAPNNLWNTMPAHLHDRRSEVYLYFDLDEGARVFHLMGSPNATRHLVVANEQVVISPSWSIHAGVGTSHYTFIWAMAGENYTFQDMDPVSLNELR